jgi:hypothetical protein
MTVHLKCQVVAIDFRDSSHLQMGKVEWRALAGPRITQILLINVVILSDVLTDVGFRIAW